jgi:hypothetical protein
MTGAEIARLPKITIESLIVWSPGSPQVYIRSQLHPATKCAVLGDVQLHFRQDLDGNLPLQLQIASTVYLTHAALPSKGVISCEPSCVPIVNGMNSHGIVEQQGRGRKTAKS